MSNPTPADVLPPAKFHGYVEVTVAMAFLGPGGVILNGEMADVTLAFGMPTPPPPRELTEAEVRQSVSTNLSRVAAAIEAMLIANGLRHLGQVDEPMTEHSTETGHAMSVPITVRLEPKEEGRA